jgi:hypothetical protein
MMEIDKTRGIILSYPRSGLNWTRYCIEYFSEKRTPGRKKLVSSGPPIIYRSHNVRKNNGPNSCTCQFFGDTGNPLHDKVLLLLRNHRETFIRSKRDVLDERGVAPERLIRKLKNGRVNSFTHYFENIRAYDQFDGKKLLVRYEELVSDFSMMTKILDFFAIDYNLEKFDVETHRSRSIGIYDKQHKAYTKDSPDDFSFHQKHADSLVVELLDEMVRRDYGDIYDKYLNGEIC